MNSGSVKKCPNCRNTLDRGLLFLVCIHCHYGESIATGRVDNPGKPLRVKSCSASFSPCRRYRYDLWRRWGEGEYAMFIGLNPSTADETKDDPTIRRCINFAKAWGYSALCMTNLFAFRATDPAEMKKQANPTGEDNHHFVLKRASEAGIVIAAWGVHGVYGNMDLNARQWMASINKPLMCLGLSKEGHPRHPLYLKADSIPLRLPDLPPSHS